MERARLLHTARTRLVKMDGNICKNFDEELSRNPIPRFPWMPDYLPYMDFLDCTKPAYCTSSEVVGDAAAPGFGLEMIEALLHIGKAIYSNSSSPIPT